MEILQGSIESVVYQNYDNGYSVLRLNIGQKQAVTVVGTIPLPVVGERLMVTGKWSTHSNYGRQFEAEFLERLSGTRVQNIAVHPVGETPPEPEEDAHEVAKQTYLQSVAVAREVMTWFCVA